jgi:antitoxin PrlF
MSNATVTSKGQVTIPAEIRRSMNLVAGQQVVFTRLSDGTTVMRAKTRSAHDIKGMLKPKGRTRKVAIKDMNIGLP